MKIKKISLILLLINFSLFSFSQEDSLKTKTKISSNLKIAYNSSLIYPGARIGIEMPLAKNYITKSLKEANTRKIVHDQLISVSLSSYHHPDFHDNLYFTVGWTIRRTSAKGFYTDFSPEIGYSRTFLGGTTYKVSDYGNVAVERNAGYNYALVSVGGGCGYDFSVVKSKPILILYRLNLLTMFPYNSTVYMRPAMELGLIYKPSHFLSFNIRTKRTDR